MTVARAIALLLLFGSIALCTVHLRAEQTRTAAHIQQLEEERIRLRRTSWALQLEAARLKSPEQIIERVQRLRLQVSAPYDDPFAREDAGLAKAWR